MDDAELVAAMLAPPDFNGLTMQLAAGKPVIEREYAMSKLRGLVALEAVLQALVYKPGWNLYVRRYDQLGSARGRAVLVIEYEAPDAYHPERGRNQKASVLLPEMHADMYGRGIDGGARVCQWVPWVASVLIWLEIHELFEFFQPWGDRIYDPHDAGRADGPARHGLRLPQVLPMPPPCVCPAGAHDDAGKVVATGGNGRPSGGYVGGGGAGVGAAAEGRGGVSGHGGAVSAASGSGGAGGGGRGSAPTRSYRPGGADTC